MIDHNSEKKDIREIKSVSSIYNAFLSLIERFAFAEITVKSICESAMISRSTFYDHFEDKYDMLRSLLKYLSEDTAKNFVYFTEESPAALPMLVLSEKYRRLFREIFFNPDNAIMRDIYQEVVSVDISAKICLYQGIKERDMHAHASRLRVISDFYAGGILSVIRLWCSGKAGLSADEMASIIRIILKDLHKQGAEALSSSKE